MDRRTVGERGEKEALEYLLQRGYKLIEKNWRTHHLEVDLIMDDGVNIRFVEVRSRTEPILIEPYMTVNKAKRHHIISAARSYILRNKVDAEVKFDIVSVVFNQNDCKIQYIPEAFNLLDSLYE